MSPDAGAHAGRAAIDRKYPGLYKWPAPDDELPRFVRRPRVPTTEELLGSAILGADDARAQLPVDLADQLDAAMHDASSLVEQIQNTTTDVPQWLRLRLLDLVMRWVDGRVTTCLHEPSPYRPGFVWAAVYKSLVVCSHCLPLLRPPRSERFLCDACGRDCDGEVMTEILCRAGIVFVTAGMCADCYPKPD